jgi:hypothetical protein
MRCDANLGQACSSRLGQPDASRYDDVSQERARAPPLAGCVGPADRHALLRNVEHAALNRHPSQLEAQSRSREARGSSTSEQRETARTQEYKDDLKFGGEEEGTGQDQSTVASSPSPRWSTPWAPGDICSGYNPVQAGPTCALSCTCDDGACRQLAGVALALLASGTFKRAALVLALLNIRVFCLTWCGEWLWLVSDGTSSSCSRSVCVPAIPQVTPRPPLALAQSAHPPYSNRDPVMFNEVSSVASRHSFTRFPRLQPVRCLSLTHVHVMI